MVRGGGGGQSLPSFVESDVWFERIRVTNSTEISRVDRFTLVSALNPASPPPVISKSGDYYLVVVSKPFELRRR